MTLAQISKYAGLLLLISTLSCRNGLGKKQAIPKVIVDAAARLEGGAMERVEYYYLPEREQTQRAIEPESLVSDAPYKATIGEASANFSKQVAGAMQSSTYEPSAAKGDTRQ